MEINIFNNYKENIAFNYERIVKDLANYFNIDKYASLIMIDNIEIQKLNLQYRGIDSPTDVISFEDEEEDDYIGEIFINIDKVFDQAQNYGHSVKREFAFLLVHGLLHLQGYDHQNEAAEKEMFEKQEEILEKLNYGRNNDE